MDDKATRRRHTATSNHKKKQKEQNDSLLHVSNGNEEVDDDEISLVVATNSKNKTHKKKKRRKRRRGGGVEPPFYVLVLQVGITLLLVCLASFRFYRWVYPASANDNYDLEDYEYYDDDNNNNSVLLEEEVEEEEEINEIDKSKLDKLLQAAKDAAAEVDDYDTSNNEEEKEPPPPPIPHFDLSVASHWDAFGIMENLAISTKNKNTRGEKDDDKYTTFWRAASGMRQRYAELYGGENAARMILDQGMTTFAGGGGGAEEEGGATNTQQQVPEDIVATACRLLKAKTERRPFRMAFGGYSVTVGRGNRFQDSFPFQLENDLGAIMNLAGISLVVSNAAIGGIPSFPYGWCFQNFWGDQPDVVSWDYSMNEAGGVPEGLEAYVRHILSTYSDDPPKLIVKDTHMANQRRDVLGSYQSLLKDPVVIHTDPAVKPLLDRQEEHRPVGFQEWRKFGAPLGAPGQALHHPGVKEHQLIGWVLAMHFLTALEYLMAHQQDESTYLSCPSTSSTTTTGAVDSLPPPVSGVITNTTDMQYNSVLFGHPQQHAADNDRNGDGNQKWYMNPIHCRTTFQPIIDGDMSEIVVTGTTAEDLEVLLPKSQMYYNQGWTLDLSEGEKAAKRKLSIYEDNLGFVDSKEAYYGIYESPKMSLLVPYESTAPPTTTTPKIGNLAMDWFESIVLCQVNEKRDSGSCNFGTDIGVIIGGVNATASNNNNRVVMEDAGTLYLGQKMCVHLRIPSEAVLTSHNQLDKNEPLDEDIIGVVVDIMVTNPHIAHIHQACSISHVVWEQKREEGEGEQEVAKT